MFHYFIKKRGKCDPRNDIRMCHFYVKRYTSKKMLYTKVNNWLQLVGGIQYAVHMILQFIHHITDGQIGESSSQHHLCHFIHSICWIHLLQNRWHTTVKHRERERERVYSDTRKRRTAVSLVQARDTLMYALSGPVNTASSANVETSPENALQNVIPIGI